jgi:hypothetical protein
MSADATADCRRVRSLLRWYPPSCRARYGEEFAELLLAEMEERPRGRGDGGGACVPGWRGHLGAWPAGPGGSVPAGPG